jgi:hypothetical protein
VIGRLDIEYPVIAQNGRSITKLVRLSALDCILQNMLVILRLVLANLVLIVHFFIRSKQHRLLPHRYN